MRHDLSGRRFGTVLADPPWRFTNRTGKVAPEHRRLSRYPTSTLNEICALPVAQVTEERSYCYRPKAQTGKPQFGSMATVRSADQAR